MIETPPPARASRSGGANWSRAAAELAGRVNRRTRWAAALRRIGLALLAAAAVSLLWRAAGPDVPGLSGRMLVAGLLGVALLLALIPAVRAARRAPAVAPGDAAWALDRLVSARGRGLAAAAAAGPAASEAAFSAPPLTAPPAVKLHPPGGLLPFLGALILGTLALLAPERSPAGMAGSGPARGGASSPGTASAARQNPRAQAARAEAEARALDAQAAAAERVRRALNLPAEGPLNPQEVAERLSDPQQRGEAAAAADAGTPLANLLADPEMSGDALARLLAKGGDNQALAAQHRREAAAARARQSALTVPPSRRALVEQYLRLTR